MIYEVRSRLFFIDENDAKDCFEAILEILLKASVIHPDEDNQEGCSIELIKCYHDETPTSPCELMGITTSP